MDLVKCHFSKVVGETGGDYKEESDVKRRRNEYTRTIQSIDCYPQRQGIQWRISGPQRTTDKGQADQFL